MIINKFIMLGIGGAAGTLARYGLSGLVQRLIGTSFPIGTFAVNMLGCLFFGALWSYFENRIGLGSELRLMVLTGFMGAFTTFSTYMFETATLVQPAQYFMAGLNVIGQSVLGLVLVFAGLALGRML